MSEKELEKRGFKFFKLLVNYLMNYNTKRACHISLNSVWYSCRSSNMIKLEFEDVGFHGETKTREPGEKPSEQGKNQQ